MHVSNCFHIYGSNLMGHHLCRADFCIGFILSSHRQLAVILCKPTGQRLLQLPACLRYKSKLSGAETPQPSNAICAGAPPSCKPSSSRIALCMTCLCFNLFTATSDQIFQSQSYFFRPSHPSIRIYRVPRGSLSCIRSLGICRPIAHL